RFQKDVVADGARAFIADKLAERDARHQRMGDSRYVVEPNVKEGKGGLRDLQTLFWIGKYIHRVGSVAELVDVGLLTQQELSQFERAENFLWAVRCHMHLIAGRPEERLTFDLQIEVAERMDWRGQVDTRLDEAALHAIADRIAESPVEAVAIAFLHAAANPAHERRAADILAQRLPGHFISASHEVNPEVGEYERTSTTVMNAMLGPLCARYIAALQDGLRQEGFAGELLFMGSNGGLADAALVAARPVLLLESGPAGGVSAAIRLGDRHGWPDAILGDMGGTTFDVSLVRGSRAELRSQVLLHSYAVRAPSIDIESIGAGGGSIAWVDAGGRLRIGPHSAGADPGPACYGRGGTALTVTDANLLLGRLDAANFLGGAMRLDLEAAAAAAARLAAPLGLGAEAAAEGVIAITNATLAGAIRLSLFEKGLDPADFALLSFGGAGGVHACEVAAELGIGRVVFPPHASTLSAWGILWSDITHDLSATQIMALADAGPALAEAAARLAAEAAALLDEDGVAPAQRRLEWAADCRYAGQAFELSVPLAAADFSAIGLATVAEGFHALHRQRFAHDDRGVPVEIVSLRLTARGLLPRPEGEAVEPAAAPAAAGSRALLIEILSRGAVPAAPALPGPAVIEEAYTSTYIPPGWAVAAHPSGALIAEPIR
ncbi:MAG: hypothetical protein B7Z40_23095, partial [Bosea sp. 12-68-7]